LGENAVLDAAMPKPRGEVLLKARCCAPGGLPRPAAQVSMRVGDLSKELDVFGPRFWERRASGWAISDPQPFTQIDIDWGNAFGGPQYALNPLGRGIASAAGNADAQLLELPAIEDPRHLIGSPVDRPQPGGFMPLDQSWPPRRDKVGTHGAKWFRDQWPYFPEDMDWTFFNTAPADQQQDAFFQGGEEVELIGLHPERRVVRTVLPRLRQRVFAHQLKELRDPAGGLWFREAHSRLDTVWLFPHALRGVLVHRAVLEVADEEAVDVRHLYLVTESASADETPGSLEHHLAALNKRLDRSVQVDLSKLDAAMAQAAQAMKQVKDIPKTVAHSLEAAKGNVPDAGISPHNAAALCSSLLDQGADLRGATIHRTGFKECVLHRADMRGADLTEALWMNMDLTGVNLAGARLEKAVLTGARLAEADLTGADLTRAVLDHAVLDRVRLAGAVLVRTVLFEASLKQADLSGADLTRTVFFKADLTGADLSRVKAHKTFLRDCALAGQNFAGGEFSCVQAGGADLTGADFSGADVNRSNFMGAKLAGARFTEARAAGAVFMEADLQRASFARADLRNACFEGARLNSADFSEARLDQGLMTRCICIGTIFAGAQCACCDFSHADLTAADFSHAVLFRARMHRACEEHTIWTGADRDSALKTDPDLAEAEEWSGY
jgi:uncharacterized protein YjbI with pentapeptide repeats